MQVHDTNTTVGCTSQLSAPRALELLAPARDLAVGQAAILAGADAVYIGGPSFGARAAAGNSIEDLTTLCSFAHRFGARVYLTLNTLLCDEELSAAERLIQQAQDAGVDALIIQDLSLLRMPALAHMEIHASTQMNIDSLAKVDFCRACHFSQIVIPREFSLAQIREFCQSRPDTRFEVFVAGAMCVSVSGICHISELMTGRSANRGACAQICRLPMTLFQRQRPRSSRGDVAASAKTPAVPLVKDKEIAHGHLLSMKDNLRLEQLEDLVLAGAVSFKIEGRLKDRDYVVNQVSAFRERLDQIIARYSTKFKRASLGLCHHGFTPDLSKTFNRGFTSAYLQGDNSALVDIRTPKNLGEELGIVQSLKVLPTYGRKADKGEHTTPSSRHGKGKSRVSGRVPASQTVRRDSNAEAGDSALALGALGEASCCIALQLKVPCTLNNGDSFTFFTPQAELTGFRVNRISASDQAMHSEHSEAAHGVTVAAGSIVYLYVPKAVAGLKVGTTLYRNVDTLFIKEINMPQALTRQVSLRAVIDVSPTQLSISFADAYGRSGTKSLPLPWGEQGRAGASGSSGASGAEEGGSGDLAPLKPEVMVAKLTKLGSSYVVLSPEDITLHGDLALVKLPLSAFNQLRRQAFAAYEQAIALTRTQALALGVPYLDATAGISAPLYQPLTADELSKLTYPESVIDPRLLTNHSGRAFFQHQGEGAVTTVVGKTITSPLSPPDALVSKAVMTCRHCLIKEHAVCHKEGGKTSGYFLRIGKFDFDIVTDCRKCLMYLVPHQEHD